MVNPMRPPWTAQEVITLKNKYSTTDLQDLSMELGRSIAAIRIKGRKLGLRREWKLNQVKFDDFSRGLLVGAIEGEGSIRISKSSKAHGKKLRPEMCVCNTNLQFLEKINRHLFDCAGFVAYKEKQHYQYKGRKRTTYRLVITGLKRVYPILTQIISDLVVKKKQAELLIEFCQLRMRKGYNSLYGDNEKRLAKEIKKLNLRKGGAKNQG